MPQNLSFKKIENTTYILNGKELLGTLTIEDPDKKEGKVNFSKSFDGNQKVAEKRLLELYFANNVECPMMTTA